MPKDRVKLCIEQAIGSVLRLQFEGVAGQLCYLLLSTDHVQAVGASAGSNLESLQQVKTPSSILLANGTEYIKVYPLQHDFDRSDDAVFNITCISEAIPTANQSPL